MKSRGLLSRKQVMFTIVLGVLIREAFSFWTGHPFDFELWVRLGYGMFHGGDPYGFLKPAPGLSFASIYSGQAYEPEVAYLPFWPLIAGLIYAIYSVVGFGNRFAYYFLLKQPIIIGDIGLAYLLYSYISLRKPEISIWALRFWAFSPFTIVMSGVWGMFDSIAMSFVMISIMSVDYLKRGFWAGMGIFAKSIPIIYAIPITFKGARSWWWLFLTVAVPTALSMVTFWAMGWSLPTVAATLASTVRKGGESMSVWDAFFYLIYLGVLPDLAPGQYKILGLVWIPALIVFTAVAFKKFRFETDYGLVQSLLVVTLAFLIFKARVTEQYAIYLLALSVIDVALWNPQRKRLLVAAVATTLFYLVLNNFFLVRFLSPVYSSYAQIESDLSQMIGPIRLALNFASGSFFTCLNILYLVRLLKRK